MNIPLKKLDFSDLLSELDRAIETGKTKRQDTIKREIEKRNNENSIEI